jgi:hypothetical protein
MTFLPQPGWHEALLAAAFAVRVGPGGGLRTLKSAKGCWVMTRRLISFLSTLPDAPPGPGSLLVSHLMAFRSHRATKPLRDMVSPGVLGLPDAAGGKAGSASDQARLQRRRAPAVLRAARQDVAALSDRIGAGEFLLHRLADRRGGSIERGRGSREVARSYLAQR